MQVLHVEDALLVPSDELAHLPLLLELLHLHKVHDLVHRVVCRHHLLHELGLLKAQDHPLLTFADTALLVVSGLVEHL